MPFLLKLDYPSWLTLIWFLVTLFCIYFNMAVPLNTHIELFRLFLCCSCELISPVNKLFSKVFSSTIVENKYLLNVVSYFLKVFQSLINAYKKLSLQKKFSFRTKSNTVCFSNCKMSNCLISEMDVRNN